MGNWIWRSSVTYVPDGPPRTRPAPIYPMSPCLSPNAYDATPGNTNNATSPNDGTMKTSHFKIAFIGNVNEFKPVSRAVAHSFFLFYMLAKFVGTSWRRDSLQVFLISQNCSYRFFNYLSLPLQTFQFKFYLL